MTNDELSHGEHILANPDSYGVHLHSVAREREILATAVTRAREMLREDDRHLAATLAGQHKGEDQRAREKRIARLLDDPQKLHELRRQRAERRRAGKRQRKSRYQSRGLNM